MSNLIIYAIVIITISSVYTAYYHFTNNIDRQINQTQNKAALNKITK